MKRRAKKMWERGGFFMFAVLGLLLSGVIIGQQQEYFRCGAGLLSEFSLRQIKYQKFSGKGLFPYFFGKRMKWAAVLTAFSYWKYFRALVMGIGFWLGFSFGFLSGILILKFQAAGAVMGILMAMPQGLFYGIGFFLFLKMLIWWNKEKNDWRLFPGKQLLLGTAVVFLGILTESYVNPFLTHLALGLL